MPEISSPISDSAPEHQVRITESADAFFGAHWDHQPRAWSADLQVGAFGAHLAAPSWSSALQFMESLHDFDAADWDHEPVAIPLTRPSDNPLPQRGRGMG